jgi:short subunit fatty acids transporter
MANKKRIIDFIGRNKFRWSRGTGYVSALNTVILISLAFHVTNIFLIAGIIIIVPIIIWAIGFVDEKMKIVHSESDHNVLKTTPYFQELQKNINQMMEDVKRIKELQEKEKG